MQDDGLSALARRVEDNEEDLRRLREQIERDEIARTDAKTREIVEAARRLRAATRRPMPVTVREPIRHTEPVKRRRRRGGMPRMQLRDLMQRQTEAFERQVRAFDRMEATFERMEATFERMEATFERMDETFERQTAAFDRIEQRMEKWDGHMATFARRSDALADTTVGLLDAIRRFETQSRATMDAIADLAGEIRALRESRS